MLEVQFDIIGMLFVTLQDGRLLLLPLLLLLLLLYGYPHLVLAPAPSLHFESLSSRAPGKIRYY